MMMDIRKIRCTVPCKVENAESGCECAEARDEIERLRAALREISGRGNFVAQALGPRNILMELCEIARAALGEKP